jgi:uncharacterized repeat protein (TIGR01451 family)
MYQTTKKGLAALVFLGALVASAKGSVEIKNESFQEKEEVAKDGTKSMKLVPAGKVVPGGEVIFVLTYKNVGKEAATNVVLTNPVPKHMTYKTAEVEPGVDAKAEVSVDGGKVYGDLLNLKVKDKLRKMRPALASDVTHVRWKVAGAVLPNKEGKVRLRAVLN